MDGFEMVFAIRQQEASTSDSCIPIVGMSADVPEAVRLRCVDAGFHEIIQKPLDLSSLARIVQHHLPFEHEISSVDFPYPAQSENAEQVSSLIDATILETNVNGCHSSRQLILRTFVLHTPSILTELGSAIESTNYVQMQQYVHKLKSSAQAVGAFPLYRHCKRAEECIKNKDLSRICRQYKLINALFEQTEHYLNQTLLA
jgi:HPt (histidine-containing phosphotransfer) domain-containing protein